MSLWKRVSKIITSQVNHWIDDLELWVSNQERAQQEYTSSRSSTHSSQDADPKLAQYYANLELPYGASLKEVKHAYRRLIKQYHPDRYEHDAEKRETAEHILKKLNEAYTFLEEHLKSQEKENSDD